MIETLRAEIRAGYMDAVRTFPGHPRCTVRRAWAIGTPGYRFGFIVGRAHGIEIVGGVR